MVGEEVKERPSSHIVRPFVAGAAGESPLTIKEHSMSSAPSRDPQVEVDTPTPPATHEDPRATLTHELLEAAVATDNETERQYLLERVVVLNMSVARSAARRYYDRGIPAEDLDQVA